LNPTISLQQEKTAEKKVLLVAPMKGFGKELLLNGMATTINLLVKIPFVKLKKNQYKKQLIWTGKYKEIRCTDTFPSVRIPWFWIHVNGFICSLMH
jgi:hypothetical protein